MKIAHLVYVLIVAIFVVAITLLYQNSHPTDISGTYVRREFRLKVVTKHVAISPGSGSCLGRIDLPAEGKRFLVYFHDSETGDYVDKSIAKIAVDDGKGWHVLYDCNWEDRGLLIGRDTVNLRGYQKQDNEYFEFIRMPGMLKCHVKPNRSKFPRIIKVIPDYYRTKPTYVEIVQAGNP